MRYLGEVLSIDGREVPPRSKTLGNLRDPSVSGRDQGHCVVLTRRGLQLVSAAHEPAARWFARLPHLGQKNASATPGEHHPRMPGLSAAYHMCDNSTVQLTVHTPHRKYVDGVFTRDRVEQRVELVGSRREGLVPDDKLEGNFNGERRMGRSLRKDARGQDQNRGEREAANRFHKISC